MSSEDAGELVSEWQQIVAEARQTSADARTLGRIVGRLATDKGYEALRLVERDLARLDAMRLVGDVVTRARHAAGPVRDWLATEWQRREEESAQAVVALFEAEGVALAAEADGLLVGAPLSLRLDAHADRASLELAGEVVRDKLPLVPERLLREYLGAITKLERDATPPEQLGGLLIAACDAVCRSREAKVGARVRAPDAHFQMFIDRQTAGVRQDPRRGKMKEYPRYQFAWDLGLLLDAQEWLTSGERTLIVLLASESAARSRSQSVAVARGGGVEVIGDLRVG